MAVSGDWLQHRIEGRKLAESHLELVSESAGELASDEARRSFWKAIVAGVPAEHLPQAEPQGAPRPQPMNDAEARAFGDTVIPFGKFKGHRIDEVDLDYLLWLSEQKDEFKESLRRYVRSERVQSEQDDS